MIIAAHLQRDEKRLEALICEAKGEPIVVCGWNHALLKDEAAYRELINHLQTDMVYDKRETDERLSIHEYALSDLFVDTNTSEAKKRADQYVANCTGALQEWLLGMVALRRIANEHNANIFLVPGALDTSQEKLAGIADYVRTMWENRYEQRAVLKEFLDELGHCNDGSLFDNKDLTYLHLKTVDINGITVKGIGGVITPTDDVPVILQENTLLPMAQRNDKQEELVKVLQQPSYVTILCQARPKSLDGLDIPAQHAWKLVNDLLPQDAATEKLFDAQRKNQLLVAQRVVRAERGLSRDLIEFPADYHRTEAVGRAEPTPAQSAKPAVPSPEPAPVSLPAPVPAATPVEARPETAAVPARQESSPPQATAKPEAKPPKERPKPAAEPAPKKPESAPALPQATKEPKPFVPKVHKPSKFELPVGSLCCILKESDRFELLVEDVWASLEDSVKKMPEAKQDAMYAIKETMLEHGKHQERIKALESTIEIVAYDLVGKSMNTAEALLMSYVYYLGKTGFAKKHPDDYKQLAKLATGLPAKYVSSLKHKIQELAKDKAQLYKQMAATEREYRNAAKLSKRAQKQALSALHEIREKYDDAMKKIGEYEEQIKKYEKERDQEDVYAFEDDTKVEKRAPGEPDVDQIRSLTNDAWYCIKFCQHRDAIRIYEGILQKENVPLRWKAYVEYQLGVAYSRDFKFKESITHLEQANAYCGQRDRVGVGAEDKEELENLVESVEVALRDTKQYARSLSWSNS